ncbi:MAG: hypothetical protein QOJ89_4672 [bacterium]|jgi:hypothetical protein
MNPGVRVGLFVALLAVIFAGAVLVGGAVDPDVGGSDDGGHHAAAPAADHADRHAGDHAAEAATGEADAGAAGAAPAAPAGVASAQDGLRLVASRTRFAAGRPAPLRFRIVDAGGDTVRAFDVEQARRMHIIVVRRDLRRYQHLHPTQGGDGAWTTPLTLPEAGVYRAFADFSSAGKRRTLGIDLFAAGRFEPLELPPATSVAHVDGYDVTLRQRDASVLSFSVRRRGRAVVDLQPYLGSRGHLVMLRAGDLAYSHVHPLDEPGLSFHSGAGEPGSYRLFLQFRHRGRVHTAAFTRIVTP